MSTVIISLNAALEDRSRIERELGEGGIAETLAPIYLIGYIAA